MYDFIELRGKILSGVVDEDVYIIIIFIRI